MILLVTVNTCDCHSDSDCNGESDIYGGGDGLESKFLYSAVSSPHDCSKRFTLYFPDRPVHSDTISTSLRSIKPTTAINARRLLVHRSSTVYRQVLTYTGV